MVVVISGYWNWRKLPPGNSDAYQSLRTIHCSTKPRTDKYLLCDLYRKSLDLESDQSAACLSGLSLCVSSSRKPSLVSPDFIPFFLLPQHSILPYYSISNIFVFCLPPTPRFSCWTLSSQLMVFCLSSPTMSYPRAWNRGDTQ